MEITLLSVPAIIVGLVEVLKRAGTPDRFLPALDVALGILFTWLIAPTDPRMMVVEGIVLGLSAGGLYDLGKEPVKTIVGKLTN